MVKKRVEDCCEKLGKAAAKGGAPGNVVVVPPEALYTMALARQSAGRVASGDGGGGGGGGVGEREISAINTPEVAARVLSELTPHPDASGLLRTRATHSTLLPIPGILVATKWDLVKDNFSPGIRRILILTLRFIALSHGLALVAASSKDSGTLQSLRAMFNRVSFCAGGGGSAMNWETGVHNNGTLSSSPPILPSGYDSLADILSAAGVSSTALDHARLSMCEISFEERLRGFHDLLRGEVERAGGPSGSADNKTCDPTAPAVIESLSISYPEPVIDALVAAKEAAMAAEREAKEREARMEAAEKKLNALKK